MRGRALAVLFVALLSGTAYSQSMWQPAAPPLVTAESEGWFQAGDPIMWNGDVYYPAGALQGFNPYQMVRSGSFRGIPLYTDATLEPYSIVYVPLAGGRMQPYERRRTGPLAGTTGSRAPSLPTDIASEGGIAAAMAQAPAPPTYARAYDLAQTGEPSVQPVAIATGATGAPKAAATSGRIPGGASGPMTSAIPPTGLNAIWIQFEGRKWFAARTSIAYDAAHLDEIGSYEGWTVYARRGDAARRTIYIPSIPGRLAAYEQR